MAGQPLAGQQDKRQAVAALVERHYQRVYAYAFRLSGSTCDAEDLAQQAFLQAQRKLHQLRGDAAGWMSTIVRNLWLKELRRRGRKPAALGLVDAPIEEDRSLEYKDELQTALRRLDDDHRTVLLMHYFEAMSYKEIAATLRTPVGTVMSRLHRARARLRAMIANQNEPVSPPRRPVPGGTN